MDIEHLRYFAAVARLEHVGRAAEQLERSEAAISRSISRLEEHYGTPFFQRDGRGIRLTDHGRLFLTAVERVLFELESVEALLSGKTREQEPPISLGFFATLGSRIVPQLIRAFRESAPTASFRLFQGPAPVLEQRLMANEIDLCLVSPRLDRRELDWEPLWSEPLFAYLPPGHPLAGAESVDLAAFAHEPFVALRPSFGLRRDLERLCSQAGFAPHVACEGEEVATLCGLVGEGFGVAVLPGIVAGSDARAVRVPIAKPACRRTFGVAWRRAERLPSRTEAFRDFLRSRSAAIQAVALHPENTLDESEKLEPPDALLRRSPSR